MNLLRSLLLVLVFLPGGLVAQGYTSKSASYFEVGDSIRIDLHYIFDDFQKANADTVTDSDAWWLLHFLQSHDLIYVRLNGHTDTRGSVQRNQIASQKRVESFANWLIAQGIDAKRIQKEGWGESRPIVPEWKINEYIRSDRHTFDSLHQVNERITVVIERVQQHVKCDYPRSENPDFIQYYKTNGDIIEVGDRFRLDFAARMDSIMENRLFDEKCSELARFMHCNPAVRFVIEDHDYLLHPSGDHQRAQRLVKYLHEVYYVSEDQMNPVYLGNEQPIIPDVILNELNDDPIKQKELDAINNRVELVIEKIGVQ